MSELDGAYDVAILGSGFAGSILALVLRQQGKRVALIERGKHPRFAIGESTTPLGNLLLEDIAKKHNLPRLFPLTEYGRWKRAYPQLTCGLKRGFSYFQQQLDQPFIPAPDHSREMLFAASPRDEVADTHWLRAEVDWFLLQEAVAAGVSYLDQTVVESVTRHDAGRWSIQTSSGEMTARIIVDASGPGGVLSKLLQIPSATDSLQTHSRAIYSHFIGVERWENVLQGLGGSTAAHPFPADAAALHHVFDGGWMWQLRFDADANAQQVTSCGFALDPTKFPLSDALSPEKEWAALLARLPSVAQQYAGAQAIRPFERTGRMQYRASPCAGEGWAMLPHAAYFLDPLFSPGMAHSLLGIERLAEILSLETVASQTFQTEQLARYAQQLHGEITYLDQLLHGCYASFGQFERFTSLSLLYFAGAIAHEKRQRAGVATCWDDFLHRGSAAAQLLQDDIFRQLSLPIFPLLSAEFRQTIAAAIAEFDQENLASPTIKNMYPYRDASEVFP